MRRKLVAANWKMNLTRAGSVDLVAALRKQLDAEAPRCDVVVCPPTVYLEAVAAVASGSCIGVGAQNVFGEPKGAFTGEVSVEMLSDIGSSYVIIGHSERRHTIGHHEDDAMLNAKVRAVLSDGRLVPIHCVGETLGERKESRTERVLTYQIRAGLIDVQLQSSQGIVIAYEPVWAIGTGQTATPEQAQAAHMHIRKELRALYGRIGDEIRILYGGSVTPENAATLFAQPDVDGGLIGGASLKADSFLAIVRAT
ncbi:MAG: triose-phosphate isomerase [Phycisphaerales bacterium]|nr:triose-phosphate isomerase [Phycisphaerales bacterium]